MSYLPLMKSVPVPKDLDSVIAADTKSEVHPADVGMTRRGTDAIWGAIEALYRSGMHPAITFCLRRRGEIVLNRAIGHAHGNGPGDDPDAEKILATPETPVCLFSASKAITALLVHLLNEHGDIHVLDPVSHYIPEFAQAGKENTTIYHLLSHRGGIPRIDGPIDPDVVFDHDAIIELLCAAEPVSPGGRRVAYHAVTAGFILGEIVQRVTGQDIREVMAERIQKPLGMRYFNYGAKTRDIPKIARHYATGLPVPYPLSELVKRGLSVYWDEAVDLSNDPRYYKIAIPAGNIVATAEEASRFYQVLLNGGELGGVRVFDPLTVQRAVLEVGPPEIDRTLMMPMRYSTGMMLGATPMGLYGPFTDQAYGHLGLINVFTWADPARDISVALLTSGKPLFGPHYGPLLRLLTNISRYCSRGAGHK